MVQIQRLLPSIAWAQIGSTSRPRVFDHEPLMARTFFSKFFLDFEKGFVGFRAAFWTVLEWL